MIRGPVGRNRFHRDGDPDIDAARLQHGLLGGDGPVEAMTRWRLHTAGCPGWQPLFQRSAGVDLDASLQVRPATIPAVPPMYTADAAPGRALESKITMFTPGWIPMFCECLAWGSDAQKNSR
jgi:hypothetical protein